MGFKLPGRSIQVGTSTHRSALKMQAHIAPSPVKSHVAGHGTYKGALEANPELEKLIATRNRVKGAGGDYKNDPEYGDAQNAINKAYYGPDFKDKYKGTQTEDVSVETDTKTIKSKLSEKGTKERKDIISEGEKRAGEKIVKNPELEDLSDLGKLGIYKTERKSVKSQQKEDKKLATRDVKVARATYGRGSTEVKQEKKERKDLKESQKRERKQMRKDQKANKMQQKYERTGKDKHKKKAEKLTQKAEDFATNVKSGKGDKESTSKKTTTRKSRRLTDKLDKINAELNIETPTSQNSPRNLKLTEKKRKLQAKLKNEQARINMGRTTVSGRQKYKKGREELAKNQEKEIDESPEFDELGRPI